MAPYAPLLAVAASVVGICEVSGAVDPSRSRAVRIWLYLVSAAAFGAAMALGYPGVPGVVVLVCGVALLTAAACPSAMDSVRGYLRTARLPHGNRGGTDPVGVRSRARDPDR